MKAKRRTGQWSRTSLIIVTCILLVLCLAYVLSADEEAESLSDRLDVVMMVIAVLALVSPFFVLLRTAGVAESLCCAVTGGTVMYLCWLVVNCRRVPFRLSRFLDWSRSAGLIRVTGGVYQFRHREFQEWLVRHPVPPRRASAAPPSGHVPAGAP